MNNTWQKITLLFVAALFITAAQANPQIGLDPPITIQTETLVSLSAQYLNGESANNQIVVPNDRHVDVDLNINLVNRGGLSNGTLSIYYRNCERCFETTIETVQVPGNSGNSFNWTPRITFDENMFGRGTENVIYARFEDRNADLWESSPIGFAIEANSGTTINPQNLLSLTGQYTNGEPTGNLIFIPENGTVEVNLTASLFSPIQGNGTLYIRYRECPSCTASLPMAQVGVPLGSPGFVFPVNLELSDEVFDTGAQLFAEYVAPSDYRISPAIAITIGEEDQVPSLIEPLTVNNYQWVGGHGIAHRWAFADIFGTGQELYVTQRDDGQFFATQLNDNGTLQNYHWTGGYGIAHRWFFADIFGNGRQLFVTHRNDGTFFATQLNQDGTLNNYVWSGGHGIAHRWDTADLFGTGQKMYVTHRNDGTFFATRLNADGTLDNYLWSGGQGIADQWWFVDMVPGGPELYVTHNVHEGKFFTTKLNSDGTLSNTLATGGAGVALFSDFVNLHPDDPMGRKSYVTANNHLNLIYSSQFSPDLSSVNNQTGGFQFIPPISDFDRFTFTDFLGIGSKGFFGHDDDGYIYFFEMTATESGSLDIQTYFTSDAHGISHRWTMADIFGNGKKVYVTHKNDGTFFATEANN